MKTRLCNYILGITAAVFASASPAGAAVEIFTADYGSAVSPVAVGSPSLNLNLSQFNPALGALTGVTVELFSHDTIASWVYNPISSPVGYTSDYAYFNGTLGSQPIGVSATAGATTLTTSAGGVAGPFAGTAAPSGLTVAGTAVLPLQTSTANPANFAPYEGTGQVTFSLNVPNITGHFSGMDTTSFFGGNAYSYGTIEVQYNYAAVPEAGAIWGGVFAAGMCAFALARRRQMWTLS